MGTIALLLRPPNVDAPLHILTKNVLFVPDAGAGLRIISVHNLRIHNHVAIFYCTNPYVRWHTPPPDGDVYQPRVWSGDIPFVVMEPSTNVPMSCISGDTALFCNVSAPPIELEAQHAHTRFGHVGNSKLDALAQQDVIPKAVAKRFRKHPCSDCQLANSTRDRYLHVDGQAQLPCELLHADLLHFPEPTLNGKKYALVTVCKYSRYTEVALLTKTSDAAVHLVRIMPSVFTKARSYAFAASSCVTNRPRYVPFPFWITRTTSKTSG